MGAVTFSLDTRLIKLLAKTLPLDVFVETGTFKGDTIESVKDSFKEIYSVELSPEYYQQAVNRFKNLTQLKLMQGDSPAAIKEIVQEIKDRSVVYWLDAHWCVADCTAGEASQCPLLAEIAAIPALNKNSMVIIDDARLFLTTPPAPHESSDWPSFIDVVQGLLKLSHQHHLMVLNDCILFYPEHIQVEMKQHAYQHGVDWLSVMDKSRDYDSLLKQLKEKEEQIQILASEMHRLEGEVDFLLKVSPIGRLKRFLKPKIGELNQYAPRALTIPDDYYKYPAISNHPVISIVTPAYNHAQFIERTIKSVIEQDYPKLEYIIQDGGSTDESVNVIRQHAAHLKHWESKKDNGQSQAINLGFAHATGEIMAYLNSDDLLMPGALHAVADFFNKNPEIDVVYGQRILINERDQEVGRWILPKHDNKVLSWADYVPQETLFWRKSIWEKVGGRIDESFRFAMDWDLIVRLRAAGARFARLPRFLGAFRIHSQQKTSAQMMEIGRMEMERVRQFCLGRSVSEREIRRNVRWYQLKHIILHKMYRAGLIQY